MIKIVLRSLIVISILIVLRPNLLEAQKYLNLNFETNYNQSSMPSEWFISGKKYSVSLDTLIKSAGKSSLKFEGIQTNSTDFAVGRLEVPGDLTKIQEVEVTCKIRTSALKNGYAGLWLRIDGVEKTLYFDNMANSGLVGSNDWTTVKTYFKIRKSVKSIYFGALVSGSGTAWFDEFTLIIDGEKYCDLEVLQAEPTAEQIAWLNNFVYPLSSFDPNFTETYDLRSLDSLIGSFEILALGESTHGSREIIRFKHRFIKYLIEQNVSILFAIEANLSETEKLNNYVLDGIGSVDDIVKGLLYWTWESKEMINLVEWMKEYNSIVDSKIGIAGFDMQFYSGAIDEIRSSLLVTPIIYDQLLKLENVLDEISDDRSAGKIHDEYSDVLLTFRQMLMSVKWHINDSEHLSQTEQQWLRRNCRVLEQFVNYNSRLQRDKFMAENLFWIQGQYPESRIIISAHNEHIKKSDHRMGRYLHQKNQDNYISIGFAFYSGNYSAMGDDGLSCYSAQEAYLGTYEYIFDKVDLPFFALDLRAMRNEDHEKKEWLISNTKFRVVGSSKVHNEFDYANLYNDYDIVIFFDESTCSSILR